MRPLKKVEIRRLFESAAALYRPQCEIAFLLQSFEDPLNVGSIFRVADACGASELIFSGTTPIPPHSEIERTGRGHERRISWRHIPRLEDALVLLRDEKYNLIALETTSESICYLDYKYPEKLCLVLGNESNGVYSSTLSYCDASVYIPMFGKGPSMNVHVAAALVAYRALLGKG